MRITLLLIVLFCLRPNVAQCGLIFAPLVTDSLALTGSFLASSPSFDTNFSQETNKGPIEFGAEGEVLAFLQRTPAANGTPRDGTLTYIVNRDFEITERSETLIHVLRAEGLWTNLTTLDAAGAFYNLFVQHTDQILQGTTVRSSLQDSERIQEDVRNKQNADDPFSFAQGPDRLTLPIGNYTLRSTLLFTARYQDVDWGLRMFDNVIGPQGLFSVPSDTVGFESQVGPRNVIPEPSTLLLLGIGAVGVLGDAWRRRRRSVL